jgi:hypothetical protein
MVIMMMITTRPILKIVCLIVLVTVGSSSIVAATAAAESTADNNANEKNQAASAGRIFVRRPDSERQLAPPDHMRRILNKEKEMIFTRAYTVVTSPKDITLVDPPTIQGR